MRRDPLEHTIRAACQIIRQPEVIAVGAQAILGTHDESQLAAAATMSIEVDIVPIAESSDETARPADPIEGVAGEFSPFEELHGFSIDGVDLDTAALGMLPASLDCQGPPCQNSCFPRRGSPATAALTAMGRGGAVVE